jgi:phosphatidylinositol alpha-mannosyltransferase
MMSATLPGRLGEPSRAFVMARRLGNVRRYLSVVVGTVFAQTLLNIAALAVLAVVAFASVALFRGHEWAIGLVAIVPAGLLGLVLGAPGLLVRAQRSRIGVVRRVAGTLGREVSEIRRGLRVFRHPGAGVHAAVAQLAAWGLQTVACFFVLQAFGFPAHSRFAAAAAVLLATNVTAAIPVTPSNIGIFQAACVAVLAAYGVGRSDALAYGIVLQAVEVATAVGMGIPGLLGEGLSWRDMRRTAESVAARQADAEPSP